MRPPGVHAAPADFALGGEPFAVVLGDRRRPRGRSRRSSSGCPRGPCAQSPGAAGRVDAHDAVRADAELAQLLGDAAALADLLEELACVRRPSPIAEPPPVGGQTGATTEPITRSCARDLVGQRLEVVVGGVDVDVRSEEEQIDAVELDAVDLGRGRQVEHRVEIDRRLGARAPLADEAGPGGVVEFGEVGMVVLMDRPRVHRVRRKRDLPCL